MPESQSSGILLIVSGPAGSGKTTVCDRMLAEEPAIQRVVTTTTRPPREGNSTGSTTIFLTVRPSTKKSKQAIFTNTPTSTPTATAPSRVRFRTSSPQAPTCS